MKAKATDFEQSIRGDGGVRRDESYWAMAYLRNTVRGAGSFVVGTSELARVKV